MTPKRFYLNSPVGESSEVLLEGDEFNHCKNVLRLGVGDEVTLLDGSGREYTAIIARDLKRQYLLHITGESVSDREPRANVYLLVGALKGDKTELVVQKAVELGVSRIAVFASRYCAAYINENKIERLNRVSREAAKQCLRARAPEVVFFGDLKSALASAEQYRSKFFACEFATESEKELNTACGDTALAVGSEGGFAEEEFALAKECGFAGVTLGKRILRAETAAIGALAVTMYALGELR